MKLLKRLVRQCKDAYFFHSDNNNISALFPPFLKAFWRTVQRQNSTVNKQLFVKIIDCYAQLFRDVFFREKARTKNRSIRWLLPLSSWGRGWQLVGKKFRHPQTRTSNGAIYTLSNLSIPYTNKSTYLFVLWSGPTLAFWTWGSEKIICPGLLGQSRYCEKSH